VWDGTRDGQPLADCLLTWTLSLRWWDGHGERTRAERGHVFVLH
jgi:hypothetical protein